MTEICASDRAPRAGAPSPPLPRRRRRTALRALAASALCLAAAAPATAGAALRPGDLDPTFGSAGTVLLDPALAAPRSTFINDVAVDVQGRILVTGGGVDGDGRQALFVQRLLPDGSVDPAFNDGGAFIRQLGQSAPGRMVMSSGAFIAPAPDGKILVGGVRTTSSGSTFDPIALRLSAQGRLDLDYGTSGVGTIGDVSGNEYVSALTTSGVVRPDGSLVLVGHYFPGRAGDTTYAALIGFGPSGQPLPEFNNDGRPGLAYWSGDLSDHGTDRRTYPNAVLALPTGKLLMAGYTTRKDGTRGFLARRLADGSADRSYGLTGTGAAFTQATSAMTEALALGPGTSVYAGITVATSGVDTAVIARYGAGGQLDPGFGGTGQRTLQLVECAGDRNCGTTVADLRVDGAGRVLALLMLRDGTRSYSYAVARYRPDGAIDTSFGVDGVSYGPAPAVQSSSFAALALQGTSHAILGGTLRPAGSSQAAVLRLANEPIADPPAPSGPGPGTGPVAPGPATQAPSLGTPPAPPAPDRAAPALTDAKVTVGRTRRAALTVRSTEAGTLTVRILRERRGRRSGGTCKPGARRGTRCTVHVPLRTVTRPLAAGSTTTPLGAPLAAGRYRATLTASDAAGNRTRSVAVAFRVTRERTRSRRRGR